MKLYFYRGFAPNFGDELNHYVLPKLFEPVLDNDDSTLLLGIGSIILDTYDRNARKIVFGSGYGGYTALPPFDDKWKFYCVRGPRTARACNLGLEKVAADAAILIAESFPEPAKKTVKFSFMPHWESMHMGNWAQVCRLADIELLDPREPVDKLLRQIRESEVVITEAMHGAIVSDALRVPWIAVEPFHRSHRFKWLDWAEALDIDLRRHRIAPSSLHEAFAARSKRAAAYIDAHVSTFWRRSAALDWIFVRRSAAQLARLKQAEPQLSSDRAIARGKELLNDRAREIVRDFS